jgi:hypothetical protein
MWPIKDEFISNGLAASNMHYRACQRQKTCPWKDLELSHLVLSFHLALQTMSIIYQYLSSITITIVLDSTSNYPLHCPLPHLVPLPP